MRYILALIVISFAGVLTAQATAGVTVDTVIHEPTATEVGPFIGAQTVPNPDWTATNGQPADLPIYGNGKGLSSLDGVSPELYAIAGTTTHDLIIITNATGAAINMNGGANFQVNAPRPKFDYAQAPENGQPGWFNPPTLLPYDGGTVVIGNGSSTAAFLVITKWFSKLDTSPRDYIIPIQLENLGPPVAAVVVEVALTVPYTDNADSSGCASIEKGSLPTGLALIGGIVLAATIRRRRKLAKISA